MCDSSRRASGHRLLAGLAQSDRHTMKGTLNSATATIIGANKAILWDIPWQRSHFQQTRAARSALIDRCACLTANRMFVGGQRSYESRRAARKLKIMHYQFASVGSVSSNDSVR